MTFFLNTQKRLIPLRDQQFCTILLTNYDINKRIFTKTFVLKLCIVLLL